MNRLLLLMFILSMLSNLSFMLSSNNDFPLFGTSFLVFLVVRPDQTVATHSTNPGEQRIYHDRREGVNEGFPSNFHFISAELGGGACLSKEMIVRMVRWLLFVQFLWCCGIVHLLCVVVRWLFVIVLWFCGMVRERVVDV